MPRKTTSEPKRKRGEGEAAPNSLDPHRLLRCAADGDVPRSHWGRTNGACHDHVTSIVTLTWLRRTVRRRRSQRLFESGETRQILPKTKTYVLHSKRKDNLDRVRSLLQTVIPWATLGIIGMTFTNERLMQVMDRTLEKQQLARQETEGVCNM